MCDCADQIERAATKGHPGLAEFLAERCDREHGELTARTHGDLTNPTTEESANV